MVDVHSFRVETTIVIAVKGIQEILLHCGACLDEAAALADLLVQIEAITVAFADQREFVSATQDTWPVIEAVLQVKSAHGVNALRAAAGYAPQEGEGFTISEVAKKTLSQDGYLEQ
ncbi:MAG: hypothetical protein KJ755_13450 [Alphaproteobacteria bacterium]|nr:hypothetical protein [Alphaproteobacteria bacterium]